MRSVWTEGLLAWGIFGMPFLLSGVLVSGNLLIVLYAIVLVCLLLLLQARKWHTLWRRRSYLPNMLLFFSTIFPLWEGSEWVGLWSGIALILSLVWRCGIHYFLGRQLVTRTSLMLKPLQGLLMVAVAYMVLMVLLALLGVEVWGLLWWSSYLPALVIVLLLVGFVGYMAWRGRQVVSFDCPQDAAIVRLAILRGDRIWLTEEGHTGCQIEWHNSHEQTLCYDCTRLDQPVTSCLHPGEEPIDALGRAMAQSGMSEDLGKARFLLSYKYATGAETRKVHLFLLRLGEGEAHTLKQLRGRFFTPYEVQELIPLNQFSNLLLEEYHFIQHLWQK